MSAEGLFDTTFFIDVLRGDRAAVSLTEQMLNGEMIGYYSPISILELMNGEKFTPDEDMFFDAMFSVMVEVPLTSRAAQLAGWAIRSAPRPRPEKMLRDAMIGASALSAGLTVYTRNVRDMERFAATVKRY